MKKALIALFCVVIFGLSAVPTQAQTPSYSADYDFTFTPSQEGSLEVNLDIHLKSLRGDLYINEFSLTFPKNFISGSISAQDSNGPVEFVRSEIATGMRIVFKFNEPNEQKTEHFFTLKYSLSGLFSQKGFVKEAILPLVQTDSNSKVHVELLLPVTFNDTLSISKPKPSHIEGTRIIWDDVKTRTIYAVFGQSQVYSAHLTYNLENSTIFKKAQQIALPPDTLYQKMYIDSISKEPARTFIDDDGNFIAEYNLEPKQKLKIEVATKIEVFTKAQDDMREYILMLFEKQKKYLLTEHDLWKIGPLIQNESVANLKNAKDIYTYVVDQLSYSFTKINTGNKRLGAKTVLEHPSIAVCTEYTDAFIGLAREKGIYAREIQGYGYSTKQNIRPLSLLTDVLHAWPEFYEPAQNMWIQVDPTWEDTSGIDYFTGFDVNHIAFAIHGKDPISPLPAGFYKTMASKDVEVNISNKKPINKPRLAITAELPSSVSTETSSNGTITIKNTGNSTFHNLKLEVSSKYIVLKNNTLDVGYLAPYEVKTISTSLKARKEGTGNDVLSISYGGIELYTQNIVIDSSHSYGGFITLVSGVILFFIFIYIVLFHSRH